MKAYVLLIAICRLDKDGTGFVLHISTPRIHRSYIKQIQTHTTYSFLIFLLLTDTLKLTIWPAGGAKQKMGYTLAFNQNNAEPKKQN